MSALIFSVGIALFATWRRWLGAGLFGVHRGVKLAVFAALASLALWLPHRHFDWTEFSAAVVIVAAFTGYWTPHQEVSDRWHNIWRYGVPPVAIGLVGMFILGVTAKSFLLPLIGLAIGAAVVMAWEFERRAPVWNPPRTYLGGWIDGPHSIAEHFAGASVGAGLVLMGFAL